MAVTRLAVIDPSGRLLAELAKIAEAAQVELVAVPLAAAAALADVAAALVAPGIAADLGPRPPGAPARWIVGDGANPAKVAGGAQSCGADGVLLTPVAAAALATIARPPAELAAETEAADLARARALIATSLVDLTGAAGGTLLAVAEGFGAHDCIVWWRDGAQMTPTGARDLPTETYRAQIAGAARIAAAAAGTAITSGPSPRAVIADALRSSPTEVSGLVAIVSDAVRGFSPAERSDLRAIAARLTRELSWLASHRRLVAEGERLLASSLHDPLTGAMTRGAFEQTIAHEVAAAHRREEKLSLALVDVVGLRRINLAHGHRAGDEVLAQVASRLRAAVRGNDALGRIGGDELAVLLTGTAIAPASETVRALLERIQREPVRLQGISPVDIAVVVRGVVTELGAGERSGEAAVARCFSGLRSAPPGGYHVVASDERTTEDAGVDTNALAVGTVVGGTYRVVHELSRGAMGVVYRGEDLGLGRAVAIKVLRSDLASDRDLVSRFRTEAAILASLHHPNLVQVYALGEHAGEVYFVMELVEGQPLSEVIRATHERGESFPLAAVAQIALEIGDALDAMHELGLIHRDVKPANVLLDRERDRAVLVDVGVAVKAGDQRDAAGTPGFAAPESFLERVDAPTTDVYGLAATAYCMLTGRPPFGAGPAPQVVQRQLHDRLVPASRLRPALSSAVDEVLWKALAPEPKKRWASASTFATALGRALDRVPTGPAPVLRGPTAAVEALLAPTSGIELPAASFAMSGPLPVIGGDGATSVRELGGEVRAAHLRVLSRLLQHHLGESGVARLVTDAPQLGRPLSPTLSPLAWVALADLIGALASARAQVPSQLVPRKVGRGTMSATFARLFGADPSSLPTATVLAALPTFWSRYHQWGTAEVAVHPGRAEVVLDGDPGSPDVCALVAAELERIVELTGATRVTSGHASCRCDGDHRCSYQLTWISA